MNDTERFQWLKSLKAGDEVAVYWGCWRGYTKLTVDKITPTGKIRCGGLLFNSEGYSRQNNKNIEPITPEIRNEWRKNFLLKKIRSINLSNMHLDKLNQIMRILEEK
jgi:hypothetical protein